MEWLLLTLQLVIRLFSDFDRKTAGFIAVCIVLAAAVLFGVWIYVMDRPGVNRQMREHDTRNYNRSLQGRHIAQRLKK